MNYMGNYSELLSRINGSGEFPIEKILLGEVQNCNINPEESICYIQNLFLDNKDSNLYVFAPDRVISISMIDTEKRIVKVHIWRKEEVKEISYEKQYFEDYYKLLFTIKSEKCVLEPDVDTNFHHKVNYNSIVKSIIEYFNN